MPSLHADGRSRWRGRHRWRHGRDGGSGSSRHPVITLMAVVVTANHYWLDALAAGMLFVLAPDDRPPATHVHASRRPRLNHPARWPRATRGSPRDGRRVVRARRHRHVGDDAHARAPPLDRRGVAEVERRVPIAGRDRPRSRRRRRSAAGPSHSSDRLHHHHVEVAEHGLRRRVPIDGEEAGARLVEVREPVRVEHDALAVDLRVARAGGGARTVPHHATRISRAARRRAPRTHRVDRTRAQLGDLGVGERAVGARGTGARTRGCAGPRRARRLGNSSKQRTSSSSVADRVAQRAPRSRRRARRRRRRTRGRSSTPGTATARRNSRERRGAAASSRRASSSNATTGASRPSASTHRVGHLRRPRRRRRRRRRTRAARPALVARRRRRARARRSASRSASATAAHRVDRVVHVDRPVGLDRARGGRCPAEHRGDVLAARRAAAARRRRGRGDARKTRPELEQRDVGDARGHG